MPAAPADVAKYTNDGVVVTSPDPATAAAIKALHVDARDTGDLEIETFYDLAGDAQIMLDEKAGRVSLADPFHAGIEVEESLGLGTDVPITPTAPSFRCVDSENGVDVVARTRAYAHELGTDRFSVEVLE